MPQLSAGKKALRKDARRRAVNDVWRKKIREAKKAVREAIASNDAKKIAEVAVQAESIFDRAARRNIIHPNEAGRRKAGLRKLQIKAK
ncbi:MAG: 30S ribosomal protein S20 [Candidatus Andersenbacteria bacterium]|nr:30S ribosomal protein S20 [Candidatus Andersenbacteria bacterium]